ncbi:hypothetical protein [Luteibacter rhizovicinus]|uniref:hypothetical protein n=1 Tax=Luteibacter rhizovicinus TaxID=242606 RepID=UPI00105379AE|nr:hypothetical protein [Luteibacter rhizovicinus]
MRHSPITHTVPVSDLDKAIEIRLEAVRGIAEVAAQTAQSLRQFVAELDALQKLRTAGTVERVANRETPAG